MNIGPVRQHVGDLKLLPRLGVRVARHAYAKPFALEIVGLGAILPHPFDSPLGITKRDELLQELRTGVLNVIDIEHHVVAHLQGKAELLEFLPRCGVGCLLGIERRHQMSQGRAIDLDEHQTESVGDVLHQGGLAVARWRDDQQHAHQIRALGVPLRTNLLGEVFANQWQIHAINELVTHK